MSQDDSWRRLSKQALDHQLSPSRSARNVTASFAAWQTGSDRARSDPAIRTFLDQHYGTGPRQTLDIYTSADWDGTSLHPMHVFIHGGFWQEGSKEIAAFPAPAFIAQGWVYVAVGYTLAPAATLTGIVDEIRRALTFIAANGHKFGGDCQRIVVSGHSAGGHLAACLLTQESQDDVPPLAGVVPISGVFDLEPIRASYVDDAVQMTDKEVADLSPARQHPMRDMPVGLAVGGRETEEFIRQTGLLAAAWAPALTRLTVETIEDRDHFDILLDLCDPSSRLFRLVTGMVGDTTNAEMP